MKKCISTDAFYRQAESCYDAAVKMNEQVASWLLHTEYTDEWILRFVPAATERMMALKKMTADARGKIQNLT